MITINATGDTTIHTAGKYCPEDILVKVPAGGGSSGDSSGGILACHVLLCDAGDRFPDSGITATFTCLNESGTLERVTVEHDGVGWYAENVVVGSTISTGLQLNPSDSLDALGTIIAAELNNGLDITILDVDFSVPDTEEYGIIINVWG
jgi:hypothetical protein